METVTADQLIQMISEVLTQSDDKFIVRIANQVLSQTVVYTGGEIQIFPNK